MANDTNRTAIEFARISVETLYDTVGDADTYSAFVTALVVHAAKIGKAPALFAMLESARPAIEDVIEARLRT